MLGRVQNWWPWAAALSLQHSNFAPVVFDFLVEAPHERRTKSGTCQIRVCERPIMLRLTQVLSFALIPARLASEALDVGDSHNRGSHQNMICRHLYAKVSALTACTDQGRIEEAIVQRQTYCISLRNILNISLSWWSAGSLPMPTSRNENSGWLQEKARAKVYRSSDEFRNTDTG